MKLTIKKNIIQRGKYKNYPTLTINAKAIGTDEINILKSLLSKELNIEKS